MTRPMFKRKSIFDSLFSHFLIFLLALFITTVFAADYPKDELKNTFAANFIEWFGVLYGILLPLILVRVWEQLDDIDREFDREADIIRIMYEDLTYLPKKNQKIGVEIAVLLRQYVMHVTENYAYEVKESTEGKIRREKEAKTNTANEHNSVENARKIGDAILIKIRRRFSDLLYPKVAVPNDKEFIVKELFQKLNEIVDIRGDRIGFASQRLFQTLRIVALIASIIFLAPFYILGFSGETSLLDNILIFGLTLLVVFIYMIIEDFDEPFGGTWKIDDESWQDLLMDMTSDNRLPLLEHPRGQSQEEKVMVETIHREKKKSINRNLVKTKSTLTSFKKKGAERKRS